VIAKHGFKPAQFIVASGVWSHIQIDLAEFPESTEGHKYLLTVVDIFSGFVILRALKDKKAETVAQQLWAICALFGLPQIIQSDNGTEFKNEIISAFVKLVNSRRRFTAPYNPRCDGKVERTIGTVKTVIRKLLQGADRLWPRFIDFAQFSVNTKISTLTQSSPFALMFARRGHELMTTAEASQDQKGSDGFESKELTLQEWRDFQDKLHLIVYPAINERIRRQKKKMIESIDRQQRQLQPNEFPDGSRVMILDPEPANKNEPKYVGPYQVVTKDRSGNLVLKHAHENGDLLSRRVPPDQAKLAPEDAEAEPVYEVQEILDSKEDDNGHPLYLTHWKGYARADATWEPAKSFFDTKIIKDFRAKQKADQAQATVQGKSSRSTRSNSNLQR
jgi:transposase InsO family protein